ncbi:cell envelope integrity protein TolA [Hydrogenovibrio sp. 3SP14C1]|uniref:cell envelope integrity protein TolA n=1 Tax=Hydrogenovibrio sp. 3SP14C1 TaxID=3038774 RepID=UPI00241612F9|nr:cell envelope integrity protein TolA [Hydrogenovibrio sp. 3SP14C1]MDG4813517.1 cell envelope integrity protein TolA [Hydrogenovibrio sp. 3SP14C1]
MFAFITRHPVSMALAIALHILIAIGLVYSSFQEEDILKIKLNGEASESEKMPIKQMQSMKTFAVDSSLVKQQLAKIKQEEADKLEAQKKLKRQSEAEKRRLAELKQEQREEQKKAEAERRKTLAEQRKAKEAKRLAEIERQKVLAEQKRAQAAKRSAEQAKKEALLAEKKRQEAKKLVAEAQQKRQQEEAKKKALEEQIKQHNAEKKRLEAEALQAKLRQEQLQQESALQRQLEEEEARKRQAAKQKEMLSLRETYISSIAASVKDNWRTAAKVSDKAECVLSITQTPKGMISSVNVEKCNKFANEQFKKDAEKAVYRAEPLPEPPIKELFERHIKFIFNP